MSSLSQGSQDQNDTGAVKPDFAKMRHDIRTPLGALVGLVTILAKTEPLTPQQQQIVATMKTSTDDLNAVLERLFAMMEERR